MKGLTLILYFVFVGLCSGWTQLPVIQLKEGRIEGTTGKDGTIKIFKGIPFAAPPVGQLRWQEPQPVIPWSGTKHCVTFGPSPMQASPAPFMFWSSEFLIPKEPIGEDCLYLNVWTGAIQAKEKRPVLVYIYGGGFRSGGTGCPIYDGEAMAKKGVVFVSINYRVGVFGFLAHPELTRESPHYTSGNYALLDMLAGLRWVQANIKSFGGDPKKVTIAGQSAGAFAVNFLVASPLAKGLFHRAIAQSGGHVVTLPSRPHIDLKTAESYGQDFAKRLQCNTLAELRAKSAEEVLKASGAVTSPNVDGYVLPESITAIFKGGRQNDVPTIVGWNADDKLLLKAQSADVFKEQMKQRFGPQAQTFHDAYPAGNDTEAAESQGALSRDETFALQDYAWAKFQSKTGRKKIYLYNFNRELPAYNAETQFGAFHSGEIVYAYNNLHTLDRPWEAVDHQLAETMSSYWINFARTGNPNGSGLPFWPAFQPDTDEIIILDKNVSSGPLPGKKQLSFWENYYQLTY